MKDKVIKELENLYSEMIEIRRDFHMYPELSFQEERTAKIISNYQKDLGLNVKTNVGGNGVVAVLKGKQPGKTVAIRADFDALPIVEENEVPYKSKVDGVMHACGHDAHTTIALAISKAFSKFKDSLKGNIVFIHQHAEEKKPGGAITMIEDGCLDNVDVIFATHMDNYIPVGTIKYSKNYILAASDEFEIKINGAGGHAAFPHDSQDAVLIGSQVVNNLQTIVSRRLDPLQPAILSIGSIHSGSAPNIIPETAVITGTVRTLDSKIRDKMPGLIKQTVKHTCEMYNADFQMSYDKGFPATKNDQETTENLIESAKYTMKPEDIFEVLPDMGGEDFSYYLEQVPGTYFYTGAANKEKGIVYPMHHPKWDIDENAMLIAAKVLSTATLDYLEDN